VSGGVDQAWRKVFQFEFQQWVDTVEKLDFLSRSQFLRQQAGFKKQRYGLGRKADFSLCGGRSELATVAWRYLPCMTKLRFSDVPHFPSFSTVSVESSHSLRAPE